MPHHTLVSQQRGPPFGSHMPLLAPNPLPDDEVNTIRAWIEQGAPR